MYRIVAEVFQPHFLLLCSTKSPSLNPFMSRSFSLDSFSFFLIILCPNHSDPGNGLDCGKTHCCSENKVPLQDCTLHFERNLILPPASVERNHPEMILAGSNRDTSFHRVMLAALQQKKDKAIFRDLQKKHLLSLLVLKPADVQMPATQTTITALCVQLLQKRINTLQLTSVAV